MNGPSASTAARAVQVDSVARHLPSVPPEVARATRVGFDRRWPRWLAQCVGLEGVQVYPGHASREQLVLALACAHGEAQLAMDPAPWPALQLAAGLDDPALACEVTHALLAPLLHRLSALWPGAQVRSVSRNTANPTTRIHLPCVGHPDAEVNLLRLEPRLAAHMGSVLAHAVTPELGELRTLRVPMRITLFERTLPRHRLQALSVGDVVLNGVAHRSDTHWQATLKFGTGIIMQATADIDLHQPRASVVAEPRIIEDDAPPAAEWARQPPDLDRLQVPVAFEIDSARVSLGELASLGVGSVIELDVGVLDASVRLVCHGQTLGIGQLVAVGEQLGVRIVQMGVAS
ncbi:type III secretion system cytoplasmic ring protein SctQ [Hydrogenophaga soli]|nr:type III secretion system cytoplasmic ring protein SctQ [Burkholderiaceae bacterium]